MTPSEFSRPVRVDTLGSTPREMEIEASAEERAALARRFGLVAIDRLEASLALVRRGDEVEARGTIDSAVTQSCVATGEPVEATVAESFQLLFRPHPAGGEPDEEIELGESELDVVFYDGARVDVGEAVAETLSLGLDPYPRARGADEALREAGVKEEAEAKAESSPFAALKGKLNR